jgi:hypothetical protein
MISNDIKLTPTYNGCERQWRDNGWDELLKDVNSFCKIKKSLFRTWKIMLWVASVRDVMEKLLPMINTFELRYIIRYLIISLLSN